MTVKKNFRGMKRGFEKVLDSRIQRDAAILFSLHHLLHTTNKLPFLTLGLAALAMVSSCKKQEAVVTPPTGSSASAAPDPSTVARGRTSYYYKAGVATTLDDLLTQETDSSVFFCYLNADSDMFVYFQSGLMAFENFASGRSDSGSILPYIRAQRAVRAWIVANNEEEYAEQHGEASAAFDAFVGD